LAGSLTQPGHVAPKEGHERCPPYMSRRAINVNLSLLIFFMAERDFQKHSPAENTMITAQLGDELSYSVHYCRIAPARSCDAVATRLMPRTSWRTDRPPGLDR
jgi:hypothetical protein